MLDRRRGLLLAPAALLLMAGVAFGGTVAPNCDLDPRGGGLRCWDIRTLVHTQDIEGGRKVVLRDGTIDRKKLNLNLSGGGAVNRGYVVVSPDTGKGLIVEDGHLRKLLLVRGRRYGGTEFRTRVRFERGLVVCDRRGCLDLMRALRR
jgi:hypothetical protein